MTIIGGGGGGFAATILAFQLRENAALINAGLFIFGTCTTVVLFQSQMEINCYISLTCSSEEELRMNLDQALTAEGISASVSLLSINDEKAAELGLSGSPSIFIDGQELQPAAGTGFA